MEVFLKKYVWEFPLVSKYSKSSVLSRSFPGNRYLYCNCWKNRGEIFECFFKLPDYSKISPAVILIPSRTSDLILSFEK